MPDRFGRDINIRPADEKGWSEMSVGVALSDQFFGFLFGLGTGVRIISPASVVEKYREEALAVANLHL